MYRVVFDTVVFVRSLINPYGIWGELIFKYSSSYTVLLSQPIAKEILEVLHRPELTQKYRSIQHFDMEKVLQILSKAEAIEVHGIPKVSRDHNDDIFLATAEAGKAKYIVSEDEDLLVLKEYKNIQIINARSFLGILRKGSH